MLVKSTKSTIYKTYLVSFSSPRHRLTDSSAIPPQWPATCHRMWTGHSPPHVPREGWSSGAPASWRSLTTPSPSAGQARCPRRPGMTLSGSERGNWCCYDDPRESAEENEWTFIKDLYYSVSYMLLLLLDVHDDNVNGSGKRNELILQGEQTMDWQSKNEQNIF